MLRALLAVLGLVALWFLGRALVYALVSDETRIRWHVESMAEGYNEGDVGDAIGPIHRDWKHEGTELSRDLLHGGLVREFFQDRDRETRKLLRRVAIDGESIEVRVTDDRAEVELEAAFERMEDGAWVPRWRARIHGELERGDDGWSFRRTRHENLEGTQLSR